MEWIDAELAQQQTEPGGKGSGLWADPEPRVDVKDVSFIDVKAHSGSWPAAAAVVRCPRSNPCRGLRFEDVALDANVFGKGRAYVCDHRDAAFGVVAGERRRAATILLMATRYIQPYMAIWYMVRLSSIP